MVFTNKNRALFKIDVYLNEMPVNEVTFATFLGVTVDNRLTWNEHAGAVCNKIAKNIGIMYKLHMLPKRILLLLYNTLILPYLNYCNIAWGHAFQIHINRIFLLQKKAMRIVTHSSYLSHSGPLFSSSKVLNIMDLNKLNIALFMFCYKQNLLPNSLMNYFHLNTSVHNYSTRISRNIHIPQCNTSLFKNSIFFQGPVIWNSVPVDIQNSSSVSVFKRKYKMFLLSKY